MNKSQQLKELINSNELEFLLEAHNGLSAKIVQEAGFKGIWASGLSISAALGVRDNNEASWTQILEVLEFMSDATNIPILLDGDTGYGNFNNMRRLVKKLEQRSIAGVCIEDKLFPKTNSFISGETQPLADINEFCGKIKAAKDTQENNDFIVVARTEAFIAGLGLSEALNRAEHYRRAGADAILVHSKKSNATDIVSFMEEWKNQCPIIIVPTKYYSTPTEIFKDLGVSIAIWANHNLRASVRAMQNTAHQIFKEQKLTNIEDKIVSVSEIFRLQNAEELKKAEKKYLPASSQSCNALVLAATQGKLGELTKTIPKTLLPVHGKPILSQQCEIFEAVGVESITVVRGFRKEMINYKQLHTIDNDEFATTKEVYSLYLARKHIWGTTIITYGDIIFKQYVIHDLLNDNNDITIVVDPSYQKDDIHRDLIKASIPYSPHSFFKQVTLNEISPNIDKNNATGEFSGIWKVSKKGAQIICKTLEQLAIHKDFKSMRMHQFLSEVNNICPITIKFIEGSLLDIDTIIDFQRACEI